MGLVYTFGIHISSVTYIENVGSNFVGSRPGGIFMSSVRYGRHNPWRTFESSIMEAEDLSIYEKMAYIVISSYATINTQKSWPSYATIACKGSMSPRKAKDAVKILTEKGLVVKIPRFKVSNDKKKMEYTSNLYVIFPYSDPYNRDKEMVDSQGNIHQVEA